MTGGAAQPDRYAVIGHPIDHSLSPVLHRIFAEQTGQHLRYDLLPAAPTDFRRVVGDFFAAGGCGLNVTVPFKEQAAAFVDECASAARAAGAVNTIRPQPSTSVDSSARLEGFNTDGIGLLRDFEHNLGWPLTDQRVLLLGAGGAARGTLVALLDQGCASITVANRTLQRAQQLVDQVGGPQVDSGAQPALPVEVRELGELVQPVDIIINATSASLAGEGELIAASVAAGARCYDLLYAQAQTQFCRWAKASGALATSDGLGMLVEQAAEAFYLWRGVRPDGQALLAQRERLFAPS